MLRAFIDDSHMGQDPLFVLAGWVAPASTWISFADAWAEVLRMSPRIEYFKYDEAMGFKGQFHGISREMRDEKLKLLVGVIEDHDLLGITTIIPAEIYRTFFGKDRGAMRFPYTPSFFGVISRLVRHYSSIGVKEKIEFVFDYQPGGDQMGMVDREWQNFITLAPPGFREYLHNHPPSFLDDKDVTPLQAADLHAGWVYELNKAFFDSKPDPVPPWGTVGNKLTRLNWIMTEEVAVGMYEAFFGKKPVPISFSFRYGLPAQLSKTRT
jgi:hypothetical protein